MLEAASALQLAQGAVAAVQDRFGVEATQLRERIAKIADTLSCGTIPTDVLRHRLWLGIGRALGAEALLPLSTRHMREATCAFGVRAAERLGPGLLAHEEEEAFAKSSIGSRIFGKALDLAEKIAGQKTARSMSFPDIVAGELDVFLKSLNAADAEGSLDPAIAESVKKGQAAMARAAASGGGWVAIAAAVGSAGFAPYIFAAQLSAFIPLVSGPGLVSFLAVIINPVTVVAGVAALGTWAVKGQAHTVRCTVASRLAVLLALRGMEQPENGLAALVTAFRSLPGLRPTELTHLSGQEVGNIQARAQRVEIRLGRTLPPAQGMAPGKWREPMDIKRLASVVDTAAVASLTAADMLFHAAAINPSVLAAADFSRHADFATPFDLAAYVADFASDGARINLRGYTAEQIVLARLVDQGHSAELAANSSMPGFDLIVNGSPIQVKCGKSLSLLDEHFKKHPDIPVIADTGLAKMAEAAGKPWAHLVTTVDGFDLDAVNNLVKQTLDAADALGTPDVPFFAAAVGTARGAYKVWSGKIPAEDLPAWLVIDLSIRGGLSSAGQIGGSFIGLLAIGPAGAVVLGPAIGIAMLLGTGQVHGLVDKAMRAEWRSTVITAATDLHQTFAVALERRIACLTRRQSAFEATAAMHPSDLSEWLVSRTLDDAVAAIEDLEDLHIIKDMNSVMKLLVHASRQAPFDRDVAGANAFLIQELKRRPSTTVAARDLLGKASSTLQAANFTKH